MEIETWPKFVQDYEGDFSVECYVAMFLMLRNHLGRVWEAVGATWMRYKEECRRVKQVLRSKESEAGFAGDYTEHDGVLCEEFEGVSVFGAEGGLFSEFV